MCHNHTLVVKRTLKQATRESKMLSHVAYFTDLMLNNREKGSDFTGQTGGMALSFCTLERRGEDRKT